MHRALVAPVVLVAAAAATVSAAVPAAAATASPQSLYSMTAAQSGTLHADNGVTLGVRVQFSAAGTVTAVQAYRPKGSSGVRVALWTTTGARVDTGKLPAGSGWLVAPLKKPYRVSAGSTLVASMFESGGHYTVAGGFKTGRRVGNLVAPVNAGVYASGSTMAFPTSTNGNEYLISPQFTPTASVGSGGGGGTGSACASSVVNGADGPDPWGGCWPGPLSTGVPAGTALTVHNGDLDVSTPGATVSGLDVKGWIYVTAPNVTIKNTKVEGGQVDYEGTSDAGRMLVEDTTVDCLDKNGPSGGGEFYATFIRVNISRCANGFDADKNFTVEDSYVHDLCQSTDSNQGPCPGAHVDGLQSSEGAYLDLEHNVIYGKTLNSPGIGDQDGTSAINVNAQPSSGEVSHDTTISRNLVAGGAYSVYCPGNGKSSNYKVVDNVFSRIFDPKVAAYGPTTDCNGAGITFTGNLYAAPGQAAAGVVPSNS